MERLIERGSGLDVHRDTVAACVRVPGAHGQREQHVRTFGTTTAELLILRDWLEAHGVTHVAMESTGVYWKPVFYVLEEAFTCLLVNAAHIKQVPGRKTDVLDCILDRATAGARAAAGQLRATGADPGAPRPDPAPQGAHPGAAARRQPAAQAAARRRPQAGVGRHRHPRRIGPGDARRPRRGHHVKLGARRSRARAASEKLPALRQALAGRFRPHHAFLVGQLLAHVDYLDEAITTVSEEIEARLAPFEAHLTRLDTVHGIARRTAEVIIAEIGVDMTVFPNEHHLAEAGLGCVPATTRAPASTSRGRPGRLFGRLRTALVEAAAAAIRTKDSALAARYRRVMRHRGHKKAVVAVAHAMLRAVTMSWPMARRTATRAPLLRPSPRAQGHAPRNRIARAPGLPCGARTGCLTARERSRVIF